MRTENRYGYAKNPTTYDTRRIIQERIEAKRLKSQPNEKYASKLTRNQAPDDAPLMPTSTRSEDTEKPNNKRYFQKEKPESKSKNSLSQ